MIKFLLAFLAFGTFISRAQTPQFREVTLGDNNYYLCSIECAPDGKTLAVGTAQGNIFIWDIASGAISNKFVVEGFTHGPYMSYSTNGRFLLLLEQYFTDWRLNKDRPSRATVIDASSGKVVLTRDGVNAAMLSPDSQSLATLEGIEIIFWNLASGKSERRFQPPGVSNSFAVSPDGKYLAVAQHPVEEDLKSIPSIRNDKQAIKEALKYREVAVFYRLQDFSRAFMANDIMDIIFSMRFSKDSLSLFLFNAPNTKLRQSAGSARNAYVQVVNAATGEVSRAAFATNATEPIYKESTNGAYVALASVEHQRTVANSILVFNRSNGTTLKRFKNDFRLSENNVMGRACFEFMPDQKTLAIGYGNRMALWVFE